MSLTILTNHFIQITTFTSFFAVKILTKVENEVVTKKKPYPLYYDVTIFTAP